jgi:chromosome segregation ATPase/CRP-like cAMP-binding protein
MVAISNNDDALLKNLVPLNTLSEEQLGQLLSRVKIKKAKRGDYLFRAGEDDHQNVYLLEGRISLLSGRKEVDQVASATQMARFALAHEFPRKHSARAKSSVTYACVDSRMLGEMLSRTHNASYEVNEVCVTGENDWMGLLLESPVFQRIPPASLQQVMMRMQEIKVEPDQVIIRQGDEGDYYYLISRGICRVTRQPSEDRPPVELAQLAVGRGFGEEALISSKPRGSTVTMLTEGTLMRLSKHDFIELVNQSAIASADLKQAKSLINGGAQWLDVRSPEAYDRGHIEGATNIPFYVLRYQISQLDSDKTYVIYAEESRLAATSAYILIDHGYDVHTLSESWEELSGQGGLKIVGEPLSDSSAEMADMVIPDADESDDESLPEPDDADQDKLVQAYEERLLKFKTEQKSYRQSMLLAKQKLEEHIKLALSDRQEMDRLRESLAAAEKQVIAAEDLAGREQLLRGEMGDLNQKLAQLQQQLKETQEQLNASKTERSAAEQKAETIRSLQEKAESELNKQLGELQQQLEQAHENQEQVQAQLAAEHQRILDQTLMQHLDELDALRQEAQAAQQETEQQRDALQSSLDELRKQQEQQGSQAQQRTSELQQALNAAESRTGELETSIHTLEKSNEELTNEKESLRSEVQAAADRITELEQTLEALGEEKDSVEQRLEALNRLLDQDQSQHQQQIDALNQQLAELNSKFEQERESQQQKESTWQAQEQALRDKMDAARRALSQLDEEREKLIEDLSAQRETIDLLNQDREQLTITLEQQKGTQQESELSWQTREQALNEELDAAKQNLNRLGEEKQQLGEAQSAQLEQLDSLNRELSDLRAELEQQQESQKQAESSWQSREQILNQELDSARRSLSQLGNENLQLGDERDAQLEKINALNLELDELKAAQGQQSEFQQQAESSWLSREQALNEELESARKNLVELEQRIGQLTEGQSSADSAHQERVSELEQAVTDIQGRYQSLTEETENLQQQLAEVQADRQTGQEALNESMEKLKQLERKELETEARLEREQREKEFYQRSLKTSEEAVEISSNSLSEQEASLAEAKQKLGSLAEQLEQREASHSELKAELERIQTRLRETTQEKNQLEQDHRARLTRLEENRGTLAESQKKNRELERQLEDARGELKSMAERQTEQAASAEELELAYSKIKSLESNIQGLREVQMEMESQLTDVSSDEVEMLKVELSNEQNRRQKAEALAQQADFLRRERDVQETAVEMLGEDIENLQRERDEAKTEAGELRAEVDELRHVLETHVEQIQSSQLKPSDEVKALRTELETVRRQAEVELRLMRDQLGAADSNSFNPVERSGSDAVALQALRQEIDYNRKALEDKSDQLNEYQAQCRTLEDAIEDRDKEIDDLRHKLEVFLRKASGRQENSQNTGNGMPDSRLNFGDPDAAGSTRIRKPMEPGGNESSLAGGPEFRIRQVGK